MSSSDVLFRRTRTVNGRRIRVLTVMGATLRAKDEAELRRELAAILTEDTPPKIVVNLTRVTTAVGGESAFLGLCASLQARLRERSPAAILGVAAGPAWQSVLQQSRLSEVLCCHTEVKRVCLMLSPPPLPPVKPAHHFISKRTRVVNGRRVVVVSVRRERLGEFDESVLKRRLREIVDASSTDRFVLNLARVRIDADGGGATLLGICMLLKKQLVARTPSARLGVVFSGPNWIEKTEITRVNSLVHVGLNLGEVCEQLSPPSSK